MTATYTDALMDQFEAWCYAHIEGSAGSRPAFEAFIARLRELLAAGDALSEAAALFTVPDNLDDMADECGWLEQHVATWDSLRNSAVPA